jgi:glycosyltransferase involved in cell wall biosynthesis
VKTTQVSARQRPVVAEQHKSRIVFLATFPPRQCGIATFTADLARAVDQAFGPSMESKIVAINPTEVSQFTYSDKVIFQIRQPREEDYIQAAEKLNALTDIRLVNIQHEFGIFGGEYGSHVLLFLEKIKKPVIVTLHTVLPAPVEKMRTVIRDMMKYAAGMIVMTRSSKEILVKEYGIASGRITVIPHGIHHVPYATSKRAKTALGFSDRVILSTFGLLNPGKGIEYVIDALPAVVQQFPQVRFHVAGVTHPVVLEQEGEAYRNSLIKKVYDLDLNDHVSFYNTYLGLSDLLKFLEATDIYLSTSLDPNQTVSGTLSYALGGGRPVISTAFAQAKQDITREVGMLVDFKNPHAFSDAIINLLKNDELRLKMGKCAYFRTRHMTWENVALSYLKYFSVCVPEELIKQRRHPSVKLSHLARLTDDFGIIQFAQLTEPDISSGYTIDDNARALIVAALHYKKFHAPSSLKLIAVYLRFLHRVARSDGHFDNYVGQDRTIDIQRNIRENSEDPTARTLYALAVASTTAEIPQEMRDQAYALFMGSFKKNIVFSSPRPFAFFIKALYHLLFHRADVLTAVDGEKLLAALRHSCDWLIALYDKNHSSDWEWFEHHLTYSNATLSEALILGYTITGEQRYFEVGEKTLNFLITHTFKDGMYIPVGQSGWFPKGGTRQYFDQQPEDTTATIQALNAMFRVTHQERYSELAYHAFNWFLGDNLLGQVVYDRTTGGCYDGVGEKSINLNQGAESTISYLLARLSFTD